MKPRAALLDDKWELYDTRADFSLANDVAAQNPAKLKELQEVFMKEAVKYHVLPIDDRSIERLNPKIAGRQPVVLELEPGTYYWCRCGRSSAQPFCDGSHKGTDIAPLEFKIDEKKKRALCLCKHTRGQPLCDGTHKTLPND